MFRVITLKDAKCQYFIVIYFGFNCLFDRTQLLRDEIGFTPLHHACQLESIALARVLIEAESGKRALLMHNNNDQKPIELCTSYFMKIRIEGAMRKLKIFVKPRVSILDR